MFATATKVAATTTATEAAFQTPETTRRQATQSSSSSIRLLGVASPLQHGDRGLA